jgi:demethylmenaquinone methyltransferase/2-methoxy-6-polyprenyl-1,4-benzoquinol methylase
MFNAIAPDYDRFNSWASLGLHQRWRKELVRRIPSPCRVLDLATGTGDVAFLAVESGHSVVGLDFSEAMLEKAKAKDTSQKVRWMNGSASRLPFSDRSFGSVVSAFMLRNVRGTLDAVFKENFRVLIDGGTVLHMDFSRPDTPWARWGHKLHLKVGIPFVGQWICGERWPKNYLEHTIESFFTPVEIMERLQKAGFRKVRHHDILWGAVRIYEGVKPACRQAGPL